MSLTEKQDLENYSSKSHQRRKHKSERQLLKKQLKDDKEPTDNYGKYNGWFS